MPNSKAANRSRLLMDARELELITGHRRMDFPRLVEQGLLPRPMTFARGKTAKRWWPRKAVAAAIGQLAG